MAGFVKVSLIGNLGRDPEVKFSAGGTAVANMSVACTERVKKKDQWEDHTEWVRVVCFGKTAEAAGQYLAKGKQVFVEGRMQTQKWTDKDGKERCTTEVLASNVLFLGGGKGEGGGSRGASSGSARDDEPPPLTDDQIPF